ncbi:MAG: helix-turn-helix domain-containing protein [Candidatus Brocadiales bacterium]|nr:helix-turn-helix domain-containing protein [Candidatus Brocadiales bacterium]
MKTFGDHIRQVRETLRKDNKTFSLRQVAGRIKVEPAYLSKIERNVFPPPSEEVIIKIAQELEEDGDVLLAMAGKLSSDLQEVIIKRPRLFADLIRQLKEAPDHAILRVSREVRDGNW